MEQEENMEHYSNKKAALFIEIIPTVVNEGKKCFLHKKLRVEDYQLGRRGNQIVALVELEELHKDLGLILL